MPRSNMMQVSFLAAPDDISDVMWCMYDEHAGRYWGENAAQYLGSGLCFITGVPYF